MSHGQPEALVFNNPAYFRLIDLAKRKDSANLRVENVFPRFFLLGLPAKGPGPSGPSEGAEIDLGPDGIAILGGGIAGLAMLAGLHCIGVRAQAFERAAARDLIGMGFILMPNGRAAVQALFPHLDLARCSTRIDRAELFWSDCDLISDHQIVGMQSVLRSGLIAQMEGSVPPDSIRYNSNLEAANWQGSHLESVRLADGTTIRAGAFIGCDGVRSKARTWLHPTATLQPVRFVEVVSVIHAPDLFHRLGGRFLKFYERGGNLAIGIVPAADRVIWFLQLGLSLADIRGFSSRAMESKMRGLLAGWPSVIGELLERTNFAESHLWKVADLDPLPNFHCGNLVLIGDAAHPVLSFTSQGASSALEDAALLADLLRGGTTKLSREAAFAQFDATRRPHARRWVAAGRELFNQFRRPPSTGLHLPLAE